MTAELPAAGTRTVLAKVWRSSLPSVTGGPVSAWSQSPDLGSVMDHLIEDVKGQVDGVLWGGPQPLRRRGAVI